MRIRQLSSLLLSPSIYIARYSTANIANLYSKLSWIFDLQAEKVKALLPLWLQASFLDLMDLFRHGFNA